MPLLENAETKHFAARSRTRSGEGQIIALLFLLGFLLRLFHAEYRFLNADEALHYLLSVQASVGAAYQASLSTAHPPLLILFLHYWGLIAGSELFLRLPSVVAGTGFCWIMYRWMEAVGDDASARFLLVLLLFAPALVYVSAEIRQYAFLLLFSSASLYFLETAIQLRSAARMLWSALFLYLALLTHYSSLVVALILGLYALARLVAVPDVVRVAVTWVLGQIGALAIVAFLFVHHVSKLEARGAPEAIADSYLRGSVFQPGQDHVLSFAGRANVRLFDYFFSQGAVGVLALLLFAAGVVWLFRQKEPMKAAPMPQRWLLGLFFCVPLVLNCILALLRVYPYGGTRHNSYLAIFVFPPIAIALARWRPQWNSHKRAGLGIVLAACNLFPSPSGQYIRLRDQRRGLMSATIASLQTLPANSLILTDDQGGLMLSYYLCHSKVVQIQMPFQPYASAPCGKLKILSIDPRKWIFKAETFPETLRGVEQTYSLPPGTPLWFFQSGWFIDKEVDLRQQLKQYGCSAPQDFGRNMFLCRITIPETKAP